MDLVQIPQWAKPTITPRFLYTVSLIGISGAYVKFISGVSNPPGPVDLFPGCFPASAQLWLDASSSSS